VYLRRFRVLALVAWGAWLSSNLALVVRSAAANGAERRLPVETFRIVERASGPVNYYSVITAEQPAFIRSRYLPGYKTSVVGYQFADAEQRSTHLSWRWRALTLPRGGDECDSDKADSAAVVYVSWKRALRYYTLKYVWSAVGSRGAVCDKKRNPLLAQDTIIVESGSPLNQWKSVDLDLRREFRKHFEDGDPDADVPDLFGIGLMSDGDQTHSASSADFAQFLLR
jgi:hypothetical protein